MKKTISLFVFVSLIATAAPPKPPTFALDSCAYSLNTPSACAVLGDYFFSGQYYSPNKDYRIFATSDNGNSFEITPLVNPDGSMSAEGYGVAGAGTWTFTIDSVNHNGNPLKDLGSDGAPFAD